MEIELDLKKSLEKNAEEYFNNSKKIKSKIEKAKNVIIQFKKKFEEIEKKENKEKEFKKEKEREKKEEKTKKEWYENFRWFYSSEGFLCIGGRDATTNDIIIKKHTDKEDLVFHTELPGSPFFVIKSEGKNPGEETKNETAIATASYSKAWKLGMTFSEVFMVKPDQLSKDISLPKGSFMIKGKKTQFTSVLEIAIGLLDSGKVIGGPVESVKSQCKEFAVIKQGKEKASDLAKQIAKKLGIRNKQDDIIRFIPSGTSNIERFEKNR
jgi:predicted ribosome quality control (RQC) complex YloA/Tae2 family protein